MASSRSGAPSSAVKQLVFAEAIEAVDYDVMVRGEGVLQLGQGESRHGRHAMLLAQFFANDAFVRRVDLPATPLDFIDDDCAEARSEEAAVGEVFGAQGFAGAGHADKSHGAGTFDRVVHSAS